MTNITQFAAKVGVSICTVRNYIKRGVIKPKKNWRGAYEFSDKNLIDVREHHRDRERNFVTK